MMFALGAASSALNAINSLTSSGPSSTQATGFGENPFQLPGSAPSAASSTTTTGFTGAAQLSPATMNALIAAQSQSTNSASSSQSSSNASTSPADADDSSADAANAPTATSPYNLLEQLMQRQGSAISLAANPLSFNV
jgi:hypothetical protein